MRSLNLRLPDDLHAAVKALAEADHRSLNSEIIALLEDAVRERTERDSPTA